MGRRSAYTEEIATQICERLAADESMRSICSDADMPDRETVNRWCEANPEFAARCARARDDQSDGIVDDIAQIERQTLAGEVDAAAARCVISSKQWRAAKLAPKKYGDALKLSGDPDAPLAGLSDDQVDARLAVLLAKRGEA